MGAAGEYEKDGHPDGGEGEAQRGDVAAHDRLRGERLGGPGDRTDREGWFGTRTHEVVTGRLPVATRGPGGGITPGGRAGARGAGPAQAERCGSAWLAIGPATTGRIAISHSDHLLRSGSGTMRAAERPANADHRTPGASIWRTRPYPRVTGRR
ncbi:hypothetical protein Vqi01_23470 [Micromonospora qiuiae]|uniref:Uncharacterized protein n=1 Tax=Micromonospora qiuiae TaxID=502268 RepID=A0ABQ4JB51_9ACTN|nr:hypothetical protein Vqi01_23470 [Micromonospora qiuiae]